MRTARHGVIDIGTNSVKVLVGEVGEGQVTPLLEASEQTRLGEGFYETHLLRTEAIAHTAQALVRFLELASSLEVARPRLIATSAARDARNCQELITSVEKAAQLPLEIISGEQEAEWVFQGVTTDPRLEGRALLILDVGGGSTEMILGEKGHHVLRQSFPMGSVRLLEKLRPHVLTKGSNYSHEEVTGREVVERYGGQVRLIEIDDRRSVTGLIQRIVERKENGPGA